MNILCEEEGGGVGLQVPARARAQKKEPKKELRATKGSDGFNARRRDVGWSAEYLFPYLLKVDDIVTYREHAGTAAYFVFCFIFLFVSFFFGAGYNLLSKNSRATHERKKTKTLRFFFKFSWRRVGKKRNEKSFSFAFEEERKPKKKD